MPPARPIVRLTGLVLLLPALAGCIGLDGEPLEPAGDAADLGEPQVHEFHIYINEAHPMSPYEGKSFLAFAFGLSPDGPWTVPGPELRVKEGDTVRAWLHSVGIGHTIHWHGLKVPWAMDGVPFMTQNVVQGENTYLYEFVASEPGTYWYQCHFASRVACTQSGAQPLSQPAVA